MIFSAVEYREDDDLRNIASNSRMELEQFLLTLKSDLGSLDSTVDDALQWLDMNQDFSVNDYNQKRKEILNTCIQVMDKFVSEIDQS